MVYVRSLLNVLLRTPVLAACASILALFLMAPFMLPAPLFGPEALVDAAMDFEPYPADALDALPESEREIAKTLNGLAMAARREQSAGDEATLYATLAEFFRLRPEAPLASSEELGDPASSPAFDACCARLAAWLAEHPKEGINTTSELPFLAYSPVALGQPSALWFLPAPLVALILGAATSRHRLLGTVPLARRARFLLQLLAGTIALTVVFALTFLPSALVSLVMNGVGEASYPIVFARGTEVVELSTLAGSLSAVGLVALGNLFLLAMALGVAHLSGHARAGAAFALILALLPSLGVYYANPLTPPSLLALLPPSYLNVQGIIGFVGCDPTEALACALPAGFTPTLGLAVLGSWTLGASAGIALFSGGRRASQIANATLRALIAWDVNLAYGRHVVYRDARFVLRPGEVRGFVAPNGWGKTTFMRALAEQPLHGRRGFGVRLDGASATDLLVRERVLYAASDAELLHKELSPRDHLAIARCLWDCERSVEEVASSMGLEGFLEKPAGTLSQGMKQQVVLAIALMAGARYVLLDEPTNGLDPAHVRRFERVVGELARSGRGVLVSSHLLSTIDSACTGFYLIRDHRLVWLARRGRGTPDATRLKLLYAEFYGQGAGSAGGTSTEAHTHLAPSRGLGARHSRGQPPPARTRASALRTTPERTRTLERFTPNHEHGTHDHERKTMDITKMQRLARILRIAITIFQILFIACIAITVVFITIYAMVVLPEGIRYQDYSFLGGFIYVENEFLVSDVGIIAMDVIPRIKTIVYLVLGTNALVFLKRIMRAAEAGRPFDPSVGANIKRLGIVCLVLWIFACVWGVFWTQYALGLEASGAVNGMTQFIESGKVTGDPEIYEFSLPADPPDANLPLLFGTLTLFLLSYVFNYGIELQKLSDETV